MAEKWMDKSHEWLVPAFYCPHKNSRRVGEGEEKLSIKLGNVVRSRFRTKYVRTRLIMGQFLFLRYGTRNRIVSESRISTNSQIMVWYWARYGSIKKKKCHACIDAQRAFYMDQNNSFSERRNSAKYQTVKSTSQRFLL